MCKVGIARVPRRESNGHCSVKLYFRIRCQKRLEPFTTGGTGEPQRKKGQSSWLRPFEVSNSLTLQRAHIGEEFAVSAGFAELVDQQFHRFDGRKRVENFPQHPYARQIFLGNQEFFLTRAGALNIDGREYALIDKFALEDDFAVTRAFEFFEDHVVHAGPGIDQGRCDDRQGTAFFDVTSRSKEPLRALQGVGVDTAGEHLARGRNDRVVSTSETSNGVEKNDNVALVLDETLRLFDHHFGDLDVTSGGLVKGRGDDFAFHRALHVGNFFRALVNQQDHQNNFRMIRGDRVGDVLQEHGLAGARRRNDQAALPFAEGRKQIHDAGAGVFAGGLEFEAFLRIQRRQVVKQNLVAGFVRRLKVDGLNLDEREVFFAFVRRAYLAADCVTGFKVKFANLGRGDVNVVGARKVVVIGRAEKTVAIGQDFENAFSENVTFFFALRLQDFEDQILFAHTAGTGQIQGPCDLGQLGDVLFFQFSNGHDSPEPVH